MTRSSRSAPRRASRGSPSCAFRGPGPSTFSSAHGARRALARASRTLSLVTLNDGVGRADRRGARRRHARPRELYGRRHGGDLVPRKHAGRLGPPRRDREARRPARRPGRIHETGLPQRKARSRAGGGGRRPHIGGNEAPAARSRSNSSGERSRGRCARSRRRSSSELALIEVSIDFSEEDLPVHSPRDTREAARKARAAIARAPRIRDRRRQAAARHSRDDRRRPRTSARAASTTRSSARSGRSSPPSPGTTRDILRERIHIGGFTCRLEDTAGIAETRCEIEAKGIEIGREAAALEADLVLFVVDGSEEIADDTARRDLPDRRGEAPLRAQQERPRAEVLARRRRARRLGARDAIAVSAARAADGLEELRRGYSSKAVKRDAGDLDRERIAVNARQAAALREADEALERLVGAIDEGAQRRDSQRRDESARWTRSERSRGDRCRTTFSRRFSAKFCIGK